MSWDTGLPAPNMQNGGFLSSILLGFSVEEKRQRESEVRAWRLRLEQFDHDLASEPERIRDFYQVRARRVEPVGLVYLWPETN